jgi:hypothetical protein
MIDRNCVWFSPIAPPIMAFSAAINRNNWFL